MAGLLDKLGSLLGGDTKPDPTIPPTVSKRLERGREEMKRGAAKRRLCTRFERGDTYWFIDSTGNLNFQSTTMSVNPGVGKPPHRVRNRYNLIRPIVTAKVSAATQRDPDPEVVPSGNDPQRANAARLAESALRYGLGKWGLKDADRECTYTAVGRGGEAFALPYFDPNVGPYRQAPQTGPDGELMDEPLIVGEGEIKVKVFGGNEVYWEPGVAFKQSRWWATEQAVPIEDVEELPGFYGKKLYADASTSDIPTDKHPKNLVMRTDYYERPCPEYPDGRHLVVANRRQVLPEAKYPVRNRGDEVIDEPVLHRLAWDLDDGSQRDFGLTWQLIDFQRTYQDCRNKAVEWKNRCLFPQWWAQANSTVTPRTDEPGVTNFYTGPEPPKQEDVKPIPDSLSALASTMRDDMYDVGFSSQVEASPDVAAKTVQTVVAQNDLQWATFLIHKADWWQSLQRHCLLLMSRHYSEPRMLKFRGRDGWERLEDFEGANVMDEIDVRVNAASLVVLTRQQVQQMIQWIVTNFPGWLSPQDALAAIQTGSLDRVMASYWLDQQRANTVIQKIRDGSVLDMPSRGDKDPITGAPLVDPETNEPLSYPGYMPDEQDNLQIWERVFSDWMKSDDYASQNELAQRVARQVWNGIQGLKMAAAQKQAAMQNQLAEQQGMSNATRPPQPKPLPSQAALQ